MTTDPVVYAWDGDHMVPLPRFHNLVNAQFVVGERYRLAEADERSAKSHNHFFAAVSNAWMNLPDDLATQFATPDALRKHALILTGFRKERKFVASSKVEARKIAAFLKPEGDDYSIIAVNENVIVEWRAESMSYKSMGRKRFMEAKQATLQFLADLIHVKPEELGERAA